MVQGRVLLIAGSDCSGGAGLEADQKATAAHGCYAMAATTALTAQDTTGVHGIHRVPPQFVAQQIDACLRDIGADAIKTGMLASAETIEVVVAALRTHQIKSVVVDPVMISTSGAELLPRDAIEVLRTKLLPLSTVLTPNLPEAKHLAQTGDENLQISNVSDLEKLAKVVQAMGPQWVLLKGGHVALRADLTVANSDSDKEVVVDVLYGGPKGSEQTILIQSPYQNSTNTHGTGCTLASAIASNLSLGMDVPGAVRSACRYVEAAIRTAPGYGHGHGPLNHFHSQSILPFAPGYFVEYLLNRPDVAAVWKEFVDHPFVMALGNGKLPLESFKGYLIQDYLYLIHFARANALVAVKSSSPGEIARAAEIVNHIFTEMKMHTKYCETFGISVEEIEATEEKQACTAYTRYVLDIGQNQDLFALQIALAPCLLGYGAVARMLNAHSATVRDGNTYWDWIENYNAEDYISAVQKGSELLERYAVRQSPQRIEEIAQIFIHATKMEIGFWEMFPHQ